MSLLAVTVIGPDRPGIVAQVTAALARLGGNLEDSSMTILRGHFAMMLLVSCAAETAAVQDALDPIAAGGSLLVSVRPVPEEPVLDAEGTTRYLLSVHGADRPGIVSAVTAEVAAVGGNITDLSTRLSGQLYVLLAEVDLADAVDVDALRERLARAADRLGVRADLHAAEADLL